MSVELVMPKLGLSMTEGTIVRWLKKAGDTLEKGDAVLEIETEKLTFTVQAPAAGVLLKILAPEGAAMPVASVLAYIGEPGEAVLDVASKPPVTEALNSVKEPVEIKPLGKILITPVARKLSQELNVDYTMIRGTGPGGRITKEDVELFAARRAELETEAAIPAPSAPGEFYAVPYAGVRKAIGDNMIKSSNIAAMVTHHVSADVSNVMDLRKTLNADLEEAAPKVTLTDILVKIVAKALELKPKVNASLDGNTIKFLKDINVGVAIALDAGLIVPVVKNADKKSLLAISREVRELSQKARSGGLIPDEITGGTFTVSNIGSYGSVDFFTPIINQPESAILGVGRTVMSAAVVEDNIVIRPMMGLSLTFDHRIIDGAPAAEFLAEILNLLKNPFKALL